MTALQEKVKASLLLKAFKRGDPAALKRFERLPVTLATAQRKHALAIIAAEQGFASWADLKHSLKPTLSELLRPVGADAFLSEWHSDYETARTALEVSGGYLLPYRTQFFVVQRGYIEFLGLDPDNPDWWRAGFDAARPADPAAWERLKEKLEAGYI